MELQTSQEYVLQLKNQASKCDFGPSTDEMIRDPIVIGIYWEDTRRRLMSNPTLALQKAKDMLMIEEQVEKDASYFRNSHDQHNIMLRINKQYTNPSYEGKKSRLKQISVFQNVIGVVKHTMILKTLSQNI